MKTDRKALVGAVSTCLKAVSSRPGIPALTGILTEVGDGEIRLTATDLEITVRVPVEAITDARETWTALIPGRIFADVLKASKSAQAELFVVEKEGRVYVDHTALRTLPVEDFPLVPDECPDARCTVDVGDLLSAIACVEPAASRDEARPVLTGVLLEPCEVGLALTASDSYRLHHAEAEGDGEIGKAIVPARTLKALAQMLGKKATGVLVVAVGEVEVRFILPDGRRLLSRLIEGEFPNYRQLVPEIGADHGRLEYDRTELEGAIKRASALTRDGNPIRLELNGVSTLSARAPDLGESTEVLASAGWVGPDLAIAFNPHYLAGAIAATNGGPAYMRDGLKPVVFEGRHCYALVMPVRAPVPVDASQWAPVVSRTA
jgi:DNA polymerase-3 subunit beta